MINRKSLPSLGIYVYGAGAIALGALGLVWGDFATNWQRVPADVPYREALAYFTAVCELFAGVAVMRRRTARVGAAMLVVIFSVFTLLWVIQVIRVPQVYDGWGNVFEELSLVIGGMVAYATVRPSNSTSPMSAARISRIYGICPISFALVHFIYLSGAASYVPNWIPPGQSFWVFATGVFFLMAAAAILSGILAGLASRLLTAMIVLFGLLVWLPRLVASPHDHFMWSGNLIDLAMAGAAWVVSDALAGSRQPAS